MVKQKSFLKVKKALLKWIRSVEKIKVMKEPLYSIDYVIDIEPTYLEFRFDSDLYDIINNEGDYGYYHHGDGKEYKQFNQLMEKYNGEFETASVVRFYN